MEAFKKSLELLNEYTDSLLVYLDETFHVAFVSDELKNQFVVDEFIGSDITTYESERVKTPLASEFIRVKKELPKQYIHVAKIIDRKGAIQYLRFTYKKIYSKKDKTFLGYLGTGENITREKLEEFIIFKKNKTISNIEEVAGIGNWEYNFTNHRIELSAKALQILGLEGRTFETFPEIYPHLSLPAQKVFMEAFENKKDFSVETSKVVDGQTIWRRVVGKMVCDTQNRALKIFGTIQDITHFVNIKSELHSANKIADTYKNLLDQFAIVAQTDLSGTITYVNDKLCEISKYSREELIGKNHRILNSANHPISFWQEMYATVLSGKSWRNDVKNIAKDGSYYWVDTFIAPILDDENEVVGFMAIRVDITEKKQLEVNLNNQREQATLSAQLASLGEMSASIAHEINNPLTVIIGMNQLLSRHVKNEKSQLSIEQIHEKLDKSSKRINLIIKSLKRLAHKASDKDFSVHALKTIFEDSLEFSKEILIHKQIQLSVQDLPGELDLECRDIEISQVLINLISNARDAISDQKEKWISVDARDLGDDLEILVTDSGKGIPKEIQDKIMESFYTTKPVGKGTGLGLSLSKTIIESHHGKIYIDNNCENTRFVVRLPRRQPKN